MTKVHIYLQRCKSIEKSVKNINKQFTIEEIERSI